MDPRPFIHDPRSGIIGSMTNMNEGLVLEGGGLRGQYTAGVLDAFLDEGIRFPYLIGVSAGVSIACSYVSGQRGRNLEIIERFRNDPRYLSFRNLLTKGSLFGMDFIYGDIPHRLVPFDFEAFDASPTRFVSVCTDCDSGKAVYYEKNGDHLMVLRASASLPFLSRMVEYDGKRLLDGAIVDAIPLAKAISEGYRRNVVVLTRPQGYRKKEESGPAAGFVYGRYPKLVAALHTRVERYNAAMASVEAEEDAGRALVIRPSRDLGVSRTEKSVAKLRELYELGLEDGKTAARKPWMTNQLS
jgi:predicted patatin/cPLA2 family phospholipase